VTKKRAVHIIPLDFKWLIGPNEQFVPLQGRMRSRVQKLWECCLKNATIQRSGVTVPALVTCHALCCIITYVKLLTGVCANMFRDFIHIYIFIYLFIYIYIYMTQDNTDDSSSCKKVTFNYPSGTRRLERLPTRWLGDVGRDLKQRM
jgi:hypothetical protein